MRSRNRTPTVLEYVQLFGPTLKESVKQLSKCGFHYFTASSSFYELPEGGLHDIPIWSLNFLKRACPLQTRRFFVTTGVQLRAASCASDRKKSNDEGQRKNSPSLLLHQGAGHTAAPLIFYLPWYISAPRQHGLNSNANVLFSSRTVLAIKPSLAGTTGRSVISTPFYLGVATEDI